MQLFTYTLAILLLFFSACSSTQLVKTHSQLPLQIDTEDASQVQNGIPLSLFKLANYTDTPRAGMRASNILEGILLIEKYNLTTHFSIDAPTKKEAQAIALQDGTEYFLVGGVSEWRYKTGIDGEPAVSLMCSIYRTEDASLVWSATGADSNWGSSSIGATAQELLENMLQGY